VSSSMPDSASPSVSPAVDSASSSPAESTALVVGEAEMSVDTEVLYAAIAFFAASWREVMIEGPGKM